MIVSTTRQCRVFLLPRSLRIIPLLPGQGLPILLFEQSCLHRSDYGLWRSSSPPPAAKRPADASCCFSFQDLHLGNKTSWLKRRVCSCVYFIKSNIWLSKDVSRVSLKTFPFIFIFSNDTAYQVNNDILAAEECSACTWPLHHEWANGAVFLTYNINPGSQSAVFWELPQNNGSVMDLCSLQLHSQA